MSKPANIVAAAVLMAMLPTTLLAMPSGPDSGKGKAAALLKRARKDIARQRWQKALQELQRIETEFSASGVADEALFWRGYIHEKQDRHLQAYQMYSDLQRRFPASARLDDAAAHQIRIAQGLYLSGKVQYKQLLLDFLQHPDRRLREEAALSLAELGDDSGEKLVQAAAQSDDPWIAERAARALISMQAGPVPAQPDDPRTQSAMLNFRVSTGTAPVKLKKKSWRDEFMLYRTPRYRLYEKMYQRYFAADSEWSKGELLDYGLFHIVPQNDFNLYIELRDPYDKREWLRTFWKQHDPTPTTKKNEFREEFERRVIAARAEYGEEWNNRNFRALRNQYLRRGWSWSPWDGRGDLVVKLGEPEFIDNVAFHRDIWYYFDYGVSFGVKRYVTNLYYNGIYPDGGLAFRHVSGPAEIEVEYINMQKMYFTAEKDRKSLKKLDMKATMGGDDSLRVTYSFPAGQLHPSRRNDSRWQAGYLWRCVVFDADYREVARQEDTVRYEFPDKSQWKSRKIIADGITFLLPKGGYRIALRVEDLHSRKRGIVTQRVEAEEGRSSE